jgi:sugar-specific transcriptional regulator TrmB
MTEIIEALRGFGLSEYESKVLVALFRASELTAKEVSTLSGVPRTSVYQVIDSLKKRGFVEQSYTKPQKFRALPLEYILKSLRDDSERNLKLIDQELSSLVKQEREEKEEIWVVYGESFLNRFFDLLKQAEKSIKLVSSKLPDEWLDKIIEVLKNKKALSVEIVTHSYTAQYLESRLDGVEIYRLEREMGKQIVNGLLIVDEKLSMSFFFKNKSDCIAIWSSGKGLASFYSYFVELVKAKSNR